MTELDAINDMIAYLGESPIDAGDSDYASHPLYESALRILNGANKTVQSRGWWFNSVRRTLTPSADAIAFADDVLTVIVLNDPRDFTIRDGALYDLTNDTATISTTLTALVRVLVPFTDLPPTAADYIVAHAALRFVTTYDGDRGKVADVTQDMATHYLAFNTDNIRNSRVNLYQTASMGPVLANNWHSRYRIR